MYVDFETFDIIMVENFRRHNASIVYVTYNYVEIMNAGKVSILDQLLSDKIHKYKYSYLYNNIRKKGFFTIVSDDELMNYSVMTWHSCTGGYIFRFGDGESPQKARPLFENQSSIIMFSKQVQICAHPPPPLEVMTVLLFF